MMLQNNQWHCFDDVFQIPQTLFQLYRFNSETSQIQWWTTKHNRRGLVAKINSNVCVDIGPWMSGANMNLSSLNSITVIITQPCIEFSEPWATASENRKDVFPYVNLLPSATSNALVCFPAVFLNIQARCRWLVLMFSFGFLARTFLFW